MLKYKLLFLWIKKQSLVQRNLERGSIKYKPGKWGKNTSKQLYVNK